MWGGASVWFAMCGRGAGHQSAAPGRGRNVLKTSLRRVEIDNLPVRCPEDALTPQPGRTSSWVFKRGWPRSGRCWVSSFLPSTCVKSKAISRSTWKGNSVLRVLAARTRPWGGFRKQWTENVSGNASWTSSQSCVALVTSCVALVAGLVALAAS